MSKKLPDHIDGLFRYLSSPDEKANEDLILKYFRKTFDDSFTRQKEAGGSDGYLPGHFVLELKGKTNDWLSGLFQGIAYRKTLDFGVVVVAAKGFLALWSLEDLGDDLVNEVLKEKGAPNAVGKRLAQKYNGRRTQFLKKSAYQFPSEYLDGLLAQNTSVLAKEITSFEKTLQQKKKVRHKITTKNFTTILKQMNEYFDPKLPIKVVRAFYSMIFGWHESSILEISSKHSDQATLGGEIIEHLVAGKREKFKKFVESHFIFFGENENIDDFFAVYDQALDAVDPQFRVKNGIFFTDLDLSKLAMWYVRNEIGDIGKNYLVIDPACGSGNLVTNWRSPMELRHKVVSEIEPELLYTVEQRMKGDKWHDGKYTVVPKVSENIGLNFLDKSAESYLDTLKKYLAEKGQKADKPLAFLCNPPYRSDDDQSAESVSYNIDPSILEVTGSDASSERYCCFLAQMKRISEIAESSGLPGDALLLLFTGTAWLTQRPVYQKIRKEIFSSFQDVGGLIVSSDEFFDVKGKFPIAFTVWRYNNGIAVENPDRPIPLLDMTKVEKSQLAKINWSNLKDVDMECNSIKSKSPIVHFGENRDSVGGEWVGFGRRNLYRNLTKQEKSTPNEIHMGLPKGDYRHQKKTIYGHSDGNGIGFLLDLTPCRTKLDEDLVGKPWFHLDSRYMRVNTNRIFSGLPDSRGYCAKDADSSRKLFIWYAMARTFMSCGYPLWANTEELWIPDMNSIDEEFFRLCLALGFSENDCVETEFPANNPIKGSKHLFLQNPMSPLNPNSFWSKQLAGFFGKRGGTSSAYLLEATSKIFDLYQKKTKGREIYVDFEKSYFVGDKKLTAGAGLIQIRDFAINNSEADLLDLFKTQSEALAAVKADINATLKDKSKINYFGQTRSRSKRIATKPTATPFDLVLELRLALACKLMDELAETKEFSRVKFAKAFYLADMVSGVDLKTDYTREAAGPLDQRSLYNEKIGIEPLAAKHGYFDAEKKKGKEFDFVQYSKGKMLESGAANFEKLFAKGKDKIQGAIKLMAPMSRDQIEIVATLYACWNDMLIAKRKVTEQDLIKEFRDKWHPEKSKKFKSLQGKKPRFTEKQLIDAIAWMKTKNLVPQGSGKRTKSKPSKEEEIPF